MAKQKAGRYIVVGAAGNIGREVCRQLLAGGSSVLAVVKSFGSKQSLSEEFRQLRQGDILVADVFKDEDMRRLTERLIPDVAEIPRFDGLIYCVGFHPPEGRDSSVGIRLSQQHVGFFQHEFNLKVTGLHHTVACLGGFVKEGGRVVVVRCGYENLEPERWTESVHQDAQYIALRAQQALLECMWKEYTKIGFRIAVLPPVDTSFYKDCLKLPPDPLIGIRYAGELVLAQLI